MSSKTTKTDDDRSASTTRQLNAEEAKARAPEKPLKIDKKAKRPMSRRVSFAGNTVDNEDMGRKSSKCCCIYVKPTKFGEDEPDDEQGDCENCRGHLPARRHDGHLRSPPPEPQGEADEVIKPGQPPASGPPGTAKPGQPPDTGKGQPAGGKKSAKPADPKTHPPGAKPQPRDDGKPASKP